MTKSELKRAIRKNLNTASQHLLQAQKLMHGAPAETRVPLDFSVRLNQAAGRMSDVLKHGRAWWRGM